jgi:hypothetical protein
MKMAEYDLGDDWLKIPIRLRALFLMMMMMMMVVKELTDSCCDLLVGHLVVQYF